MNSKLQIHWFRYDLRIADNPALHAALTAGHVLPVFILDDTDDVTSKIGSASKWWLHQGLQSLNLSLGNRLFFCRGDSKEIIPRLAEQYGVEAVFWNRCYEPHWADIDRVVEEKLVRFGVAAKSFNGSQLWEPWEVDKRDGEPYKVFTPFFKRGCLSHSLPDEPVGLPELYRWKDNIKSQMSLEDLGLLSSHDWYQGLRERWVVSEDQAQKTLSGFLEEKLSGYSEGRDYPAQPKTSDLAPLIRWGQVSIHRIYRELCRKRESYVDLEAADRFFSQLGWREFSHCLLHHFPGLPDHNMQKKFDAFPWIEDDFMLKSWQSGNTGIPFVDAAMRELWQTGFMHNRLRMVVGSFLVKNLLIDWRLGRDWFWDCLVDADLANNSMGWQWIAGCGVDAAPYFRVFNPVLQGKKFDAGGEYTRRFVPELERLPTKFLFNPWEASDSILSEAGVVLGETYPRPIVDLRASRIRALKAYASIRGDKKTSQI